jgi:hypothetical protein
LQQARRWAGVKRRKSKNHPAPFNQEARNPGKGTDTILFGFSDFLLSSFVFVMARANKNALSGFPCSHRPVAGQMNAVQYPRDGAQRRGYSARAKTKMPCRGSRFGCVLVKSLQAARLPLQTKTPCPIFSDRAF